MSRLVAAAALSGLLLMACASDPASTMADRPEPTETERAATSTPVARVLLVVEPVTLAVGDTVLVPVAFDPGDLVRQANAAEGSVQLVIRERSMTDNSFALALTLVERATGAEVLLDDMVFFDQRSAAADPDLLIRSEGEFGYFFADVTDALREVSGIGSTDFDLRVGVRPIHDDEISDLKFSLNDVSLVVTGN